MKRMIFLVILFTSVILPQQVDTTDFFPIQTGNYWEYAASTINGPEYFSIKVLGDTLMPNGKVYKYISSLYGNYFRKDSGNVYQYLGNDTACSEFKYLDFAVKDSTVWKICRDLGPCGNAKGIANTYYDYTYYTFFQKPLETKHFQDVLVNSTDTVWTPCESSEYWLSKGIGITRIFMFNVGDFWLQGAIINGKQFGTLVSIDNEKSLIPPTFKIQAYPNPFNSTVNFNITLSKSGITEVSLYNILGEKVTTLIKEYGNPGSYNVRYNAGYLSSGIYLVVLSQGNNSSIQKIILLK